MADIKKIKVGDTTYDIRDATAARSTHNHDNVYVKYSAAQSLNDAQKKQARDNISAVSTNKDETISGLKTFAAPSNQSGKEQATVWFNTANGGRVGFGKEGANSGTGIFFDQESGTRRLNFRASSTAGAMVWSQPESGSRLYYDVGGVSFRQCSAISFDMFKSAGYLYTDSSGNLQKGSLAKVAKSGSYSDLSDKPTIPTVNNATLTIQKNGTTIDTFTANSSTNKTVNITVPTGAAASKGVDTSISAASTSINLPTSAAVAAFVEGKGYASSSHTHGVSGHTAAGAHIASVTGASYTPAGSVTVTPNTTTVNSITAVGSLPSLTYENSTVKSVTEFSAGSVPSRSSFTYATGAFTSTAKALTGVKASGTDTFLKTVSEGSGNLEVYNSDTATTANEAAASGRIPYVSGVTYTAPTTNTTAVLTGVKVSSSKSAAPGGHTHTVTVSGTTAANTDDAIVVYNGLNASGTGPTVATGASGTATVLTGVKASGTDTFIKTINSGSGSLAAYDAATAGNVTVANGNRIPVVTGVTLNGASVSSTGNAAPHSHTHSVTVSGTTGKNSNYDNTETVLTDITSGTTNVLTGVKVTAQPTVSLTADAATATGRIKYVESISGGSGSLSAYDAATNGTVKVSNGTRIPFITSLSKGYTPAGTVTLTNGTAPSMGSATTRYLSASFTGTLVEASEMLAVPESAPTGAPSSTTSNVIKGTYSEGTLTLTTVTVASNNHTHDYAHKHTFIPEGSVTLTANTSDATGRIKYVEAQGTFSEGTTPKASASFSGTNNTNVVIGGTTHYLAHSHTGAGAVTKHLSASVSDIAVGADGTAAAITSINKTTTTLPAGDHTHTYGSSTALTTGTSSGSAITAVTGIDGGSLNVTTNYLAHTHTGASSKTTASAVTGVAANGTTTAVTGVSTTKFVTANAASYVHTHPYGSSTALTTSANSGSNFNAATAVGSNGTANAVTSVGSGGVTTDIKYLKHTHTPSTEGTTASAVTGVAANGTATVPTALTTATAYSITSVGSAPSLTTEDKELSKISAWSAGTLPTKGSNQTVVTGIKSSSFSGTAATITPTVTVTGNSITTDADTE